MRFRGIVRKGHMILSSELDTASVDDITHHILVKRILIHAHVGTVFRNGACEPNIFFATLDCVHSIYMYSIFLISNTFKCIK